MENGCGGLPVPAALLRVRILRNFRDGVTGYKFQWLGAIITLDSTTYNNTRMALAAGPS